MPYSTADKLAAYIGAANCAEYVRREGPESVPDALAAAEGRVNSYLGRFALPPAGPVPDLVRCETIIAGYDVMVSLGYVVDDASSAWRLRYLDEIRWLEKVAKGELTPPGLETPLPPGQDPFAGLGTFVQSDPPRGW